MYRYIARRLLWLIPVLFFVALVTFSLAHAVPGGPFDREKRLPVEIMANLNKKYHLDDPLPKQFVDYVGGIVIPRIEWGTPSNDYMPGTYLVELHLGNFHLKWGDFGPSYASRARTVSDIFRDHLPVSAELGMLALFVAVGLGVPLGIIAALKQNTFWDYLGMGIAIFGVSVPAIVLGPLVIWVFCVIFRIFPVGGWGKPSQMVLPSVVLGLGSSAIIARLTRASMLQVIREDYIRTARAKGLTERAVMIRHALKNAFIPVATILGPMFAALVTGTFVVEQIFAIPGMGKYFVTSVTNRDYPVIMGTILLYAVFLVLANLAVDITYAFLDPRIRFD